MGKLKQKLIALFMISAFVMSALPSVAVVAQTQAQTQEKSSVKSVPMVGNIYLKNGNKRLSVSLRDSDVKQALRMFADKAGLNIIFHSSVEDGQTITLDLVGVTLNDALRMVMQATDLTYYVDGQTIIIMSAEKSKELNVTKQNMMVLPVKYADATEVAEFLNKNVFSINKPGLSNTEIVAVNPKKNELIIFGTQSDYDVSKKILDMLDEPTRITNFKVNHVTPKEMAEGVCNALFKSYSDEKIDEQNNSDEENNEEEENEDSNSNSSDSASNASHGIKAGSSGEKRVKLGEVKIACVTGKYKEEGQQQQQQQGGPKVYSFNQNALKVLYFETLGTVSVVGGSQEQIDSVAAFISAADVKQPMAYLEMTIVELNEEGSKTFHNDWELFTRNLQFTLSGGIMGTIDWLQRGGKAPEGGVTLSHTITYLIENGKGNVLANPKVMITSGKKSLIDLSSDYVKKTRVETTTTTSTHTEKEYELGNDEGIVVALTPFISKDGYIVMNLAPSYSTIKDQYYGDNNNVETTLLQRRSLELQNVRVKDNETLVIAGMIREINTNTVEKIPILGDIPGLGFFFRNVDTTKSKEELVILITPHIISDATDLVDNGNNNL